MEDIQQYRRRIGLFCFRGPRGNKTVSIGNSRGLVIHGKGHLRRILMLVLTLLAIGNIELNLGPFTRGGSTSKSFLQRKDLPRCDLTSQFSLTSDDELLSTLSGSAIFDDSRPRAASFSETGNLEVASLDVRTPMDSKNKRKHDLIVSPTTLDDLKNLIISQGTESKNHFVSLSTDFRNLESRISLKLLKMEEENRANKIEIQALNNKIDHLNKEVAELKWGTNQNEDYSKKCNLVVRNIKTDDNVAPMDVIVENFAKHLGVNFNQQRISACHYLPARSGHKPILIKFISLIDRNYVLGKFRELRRNSELNTENFRIAEHFSNRTRIARQKLFPFLSAAIAEKKNATLIDDTIRIEGVRYRFNEATQTLEEEGRRGQGSGRSRVFARPSQTVPRHSPVTVELTPPRADLQSRVGSPKGYE